MKTKMVLISRSKLILTIVIWTLAAGSFGQIAVAGARIAAPNAVEAASTVAPNAQTAKTVQKIVRTHKAAPPKAAVPSHTILPK